MALKDQLANDLKQALRDADDDRKRTIRLALASIHNTEIAVGHGLTEPEVLEVLRKEVKQWRDSIEEYAKAARKDLVDLETREMVILQTYLPQLMSQDAI